MSKLKIITHSGAFHADDVCAVAVLDLLHKGEVEVVRTRDAAVMATGDIVLDVGGVNDGQKFFDHHQPGGAGLRENGIPYASFGLIWKRFGEELAGSKAVADKFDKVFIQGVDAIDNGVTLTESKFKDVYPLSFNSLVMAFNPFWNEGDNLRDVYFLDAVEMFKKIISREINFLKVQEEAKDLVRRDYEKASDKRIIVLEDHYPFEEILSGFPEAIFAIYPSPQLESYHVKTIWLGGGEAFKTRKDFPAAWAGKINEELAALTGVPDALFCHNKLFLATAKTKEGALALAMKALNS